MLTAKATITNMTSENRPRERLKTVGTSALSDAELVAIILRSGGGGLSALGLANDLISKFGGIRGLLAADIHQLLAVRHMGLAKACSIKAVSELCQRSHRVLDESTKVYVRNPEDVYSLLRPFLFAKKQECLYVLCLDSHKRLIAKELVSVGSLTETVVSARDIFARAIHKNSVSIILAHNHPSGEPTPSDQDIAVTKRILKAGTILGIPLIDHVIICDNEFVSLKVANLLISGGGEHF